MRVFLICSMLMGYSFLMYSQNVGVGTSTPLAPLHVKGENSEVLRLQAFSPYISFFNSSDQYQGYLWAQGGSMILGSSNNLPVSIQANYQQTATFLPNGNVGINNINPNQKLDVQGKIKISDDTSPALKGSIRYNEATQDFEGYNGQEWLSFTAATSQGNWPNKRSNDISNYCQARPDDNNEADYFGLALDMNKDHAFISAPNKETGQGVVYVYKKEGQEWKEVQKILSPDGPEIASFGSSISSDSIFLAVGANSDPIGANTAVGSVSIYTLSGNSWTFLQKIVPPSSASDQVFGGKVKLHRQSLLIGAADTAYLYQLNAGQYTLQQKFYNAAQDNFGSQIDMSDTHIAITGNNSGSGISEVFLYNKTGTNYTLVDNISNPSLLFGINMKFVKDNIIAISDYYYNGQGITYMYKYDGISDWQLIKSILPPVSELGQKFGSSIEVDGDYIYIGAAEKDVIEECAGTPLADHGEVYIYSYKNNLLSYITKIFDPNGTALEGFGYNIGASQNHFVIGSYLHSEGAGNINVGKVIFGKK
jgi:FG-GAP repeat